MITEKCYISYFILSVIFLFRQIQQILDDKSEPLPGEEKLAALTAINRVDWANTRRNFFTKGINKLSLDVIEKAAFVVALDDFPYEYDEVMLIYWVINKCLF